MKLPILIAGALLAAVSFATPADAQGVPGGFVHGVNEGNRRAGPVGAVVGGVVGGVIGGVEGVLGIGPAYQQPYPVYQSQPTYRVYTERPRRSYRRSKASRKAYRYSSHRRY